MFIIEDLEPLEKTPEPKFIIDKITNESNPIIAALKGIQKSYKGFIRSDNKPVIVKITLINSDKKSFSYKIKRSLLNSGTSKFKHEIIN